MPSPTRLRLVVARTTTALAALLVGAALLVPNELDRLTPGAFLRIPVEALVGIAVVLVLPGRSRLWAAGIGGAVLGVLTVLAVFDMGFFAVLDRPFDPLVDWTFLSAGTDYLARSIGPFGAAGAVVGAALLTLAALTLMTLAMIRLTRVAVRHRRTTARTAVVLAVVWATCAAFGAHLVPGVPVAASTAAGFAYDSALKVRDDLRDHRSFAAEAANDAYRYTPSAQFMTGLRGKDVIVAFVESYGRVAIEHPDIAPRVDAVLATGNDTLRAAGYSSRSAFLTSSTYGGGSWLAHSTLASGLWINSQQRYHDLAETDRLTLNLAFRRAGWRTVAVEPANSEDLPARVVAGFDKVYDERNLGYRGHRFNFNSMPDQYAMAVFQRSERAAPGHAPVMAEIALLSGHSPWTPLPQLIDWNDVGAGYAFAEDPETTGQSGDVLTKETPSVRADYGRAMEYSLTTLISYVTTYGDDNLVLVVLGDHQPASVVTGDDPNRDVPISIIAHDPAVLEQISGWGWQDGLNPDPQAPVWRMDTFRDKFLAAYGS